MTSVQREHLATLMMSMIQGHRVAKTCVIGQSSLQGLLVERFDRHLDRGHIHRIHQEDFCQALGLGPSLKYERNGIPPRAFSAEVVGSLLDLTQLPGVARLAFFEITVANILLGNSDNHAKNHAFLYTGRRPVLAPAYDIDPVMLDDVSHEMSFRVGSARMGDDVTGADLDLFLKSIGMRGFGSRQKQRCGEIVRLAVLAASDLPRPAGKLLGDEVHQVHARQVMVLCDLSFGPAVLILEPHPPAVLEGRLYAHLGTPDLFQRGISQLDDVETVEGDGRVRQMPTDAGNIGTAHVDAGGSDGVRIATMSAEVFGEGLDRARVAALTGKEQSARLKIMEQGNVIVTAPRCCLVDTDSRHVAEILQFARRRDVVIKHAPYSVVADLEKIGDGLHRHLSG